MSNVLRILKKPLIALSGLIVLLVTLSGCETFGNGSPVIDTTCLIFRPISQSKHDTEQTRVEIDEHNARFLALCEE